jgi:high-affinity nickel-transport protein
MNDNFSNFGYAVVGIFIASWIISTVVYRAKRYDELQVSRL